MIWSYLLHLGYNMWSDPVETDGFYEGAMKLRSHHPYTAKTPCINASATLRFDMDLFKSLSEYAADAGVNMFVMDVGEGIQYESHPEISAKGAWTKEELHKNIKYLNELGIEVIPKLNFSACHDQWLGEYARMVSTSPYYKVVADVIKEVAELFGKPRYFHIGMDEETHSHQVNSLYSLVRQGDLWWHDFYYIIKQVEASGSRPWMWSDYIWHHEKEFLEKMPLDVLQSNWYYGNVFDYGKASISEKTYLKAFELLDQKGFKQIPTGSNWSCKENFGKLVNFCNKTLSNNNIFGYMQTPWQITLPDKEKDLFDAVDLMKTSINK